MCKKYMRFIVLDSVYFSTSLLKFNLEGVCFFIYFLLKIIYF